MNELSRMERHQSRHKGRKKNKAAARSQHKAGMEHAPYASEGSEEIEGLSRTRSAKLRGNDASPEEEVPPSRTSTYPSQRVRMSKWFVNTLIVLFILLMAGLLIWGLIGAPPLEEIL
ncbi:hypothetical protein MNQ98_10950 [Paenibacillus sp. N3/727]|uniref:hypothetical protein n=1 Tax=Paenibacillus sp. N3/727 TaxID=2925845 RepID=UPI001F538323|nr:hypothetical protein [Paenibacillus sp. N3/727]UNK20490.1 hypothetical protein MNQ98_10950 [Paenibacillus sp. N3/727]